MATNESPARRELTFHDRLSRLTYVQACRLLGPDGSRLIQRGGKQDVDVRSQVYLGGDLFRLKLPGTVVTITQMAERPSRLQWNCTACQSACEHVGAAFSVILEEKTLLGLAEPPPERVPAETLGEKELVQRAIAERQERARTERMRIKPVKPGTLWTDYVVTSSVSGKTYRVALRGWEPGEVFCTCPDFRSNTLGTCKHVMKVQAWARRRFPASRQKRPYVQTQIAVHVRYAGQRELRLLLPPKLEPEIESIVKPLRGKPVRDVAGLLRRIARLEKAGREVLIYPDAEELINQQLFQKRIENKAADIRRSPARHPLRKELLKAELLPYQLDGIAFAVGAGRAILADDMGLGKTIQGIGTAELLAREAGIRKTLIICPTSLKSQWRNEIHRFCNRDCQLVVGSAPQRARQYDNDSFFTICNYEQVLRDLMTIERVKWDLIILDEGQRIKNWEAKTSQVVKALRSPFALVLSGTPLENRLDDLFSVAQFVDGNRLGPAFRFFNRHRIVDENGRVLGYKNLDLLRKTLRPILLRRTRESVMNQLPPRNTEIVRIAPTGEQIELHDANMQIVSQIANKAYITEMDLLRLQKALLLCRMAADSTYLVTKEPPGYSSKLEQLDGLLEQLVAEPQRKIILFSEWTTMLGLIEPLLEKRGVKYVRLDGSVPQRKRQALVHAFQNDPLCRLFITTNAGSTGLNLQAADTVINVDLPWNPAVLEQRIARAHRMGQKRPVQVYVLVTEQTLEERLLSTLSAKHQLALAALDVESDVDQVDLVSGMEELRRRLEILLGARPEAPTDESERERLAREAEQLAQRDQLAAAGGELLSSAFKFLAELVPAAGPEKAAAGSPNGTGDAVTDRIRESLVACTRPDEKGRLQLTLTLPDPAAVENLAGSLARLLRVAPVPAGSNGQTD